MARQRGKGRKAELQRQSGWDVWKHEDTHSHILWLSQVTFISATLPCWLLPQCLGRTVIPLSPSSLYVPYYPCTHPSIHPAIQPSTQACPGVTVPTNGWSHERWRERGDTVRDGGKMEGCKCAAAVMLHIDVALNTCNSVYMQTHTHNKCKLAARRGLLKGRSSLTQVFWEWIDKILNCQCWLVGPPETNGLLQLLYAADEIRLLRGSCEQGSNDGRKVKTILCRSYDILRLWQRLRLALVCCFSFFLHFC